MYVTKFKQAENKVSIRAFGKCIFGRCDNSCMGTEIRLMLGRYLLVFAMRLESKGISPLYTRV